MRGVALILGLVAGCTATWPEIVDTRSLPAGGRPVIRRIRDLGSGPPTLGGRLTGESDGVAVVGELMLIEGTGFGKLPTVSIGGRAAAVLARTEGGGVVARVPIGIRGGPGLVVVEVGGRQSKELFPLRRLGLVRYRDQLIVVEADTSSLRRVGQPIVASGSRSVAISPDGACAYWLGDQRLKVVDLGAAGGPRVVGEQALSLPATDLRVARRTPVLVALGERGLEAFDVTRACFPARHAPAALPLAGRAYAISASGDWLASIAADSNRLVVVDISRRTSIGARAETVLFPDSHAPIVRALDFGDDETIWVAAGGSSEASRVAAVRFDIAAGGPALATSRAQTLECGAVPFALRAVPPVQPASATTIRMAPVKNELVLLEAIAGGGHALRVVDFVGEPARAPVDSRLGLVEVADSLAVATAVRSGAQGEREFGLQLWRLDAKLATSFVRLLGEDARAPMADFGELRLQP